ncbi:uncharacterized protein LOC111023093 isoform X3 [Momordica charantia]|uniref:Uncharacterized protein LOC111023093 isoform X3 n=1 Tax=Momordica charantia TaxID=3673 RepID=A0A6J1DR81_MOMCH|nr:uncharacterized protein LOC111023093 isoform X3 [Momordica charantia]
MRDFTKGILSAEGARTAYNYAGDFYYAHGAILEAILRYKRTQFYNVTSRSYHDLGSRVIIVFIEMGKFPLFASIAGKELTHCDPITAGKLRCAFGLGLLKTQRFRDAADKMMANVFSTTIEALEKKLISFINTNQIKAKIDSADKVLYARKDD